MTEPIHIISLGAGVQSSAMALMACYGEIKPMPECAIFSDTGDESQEVYRWIKELCRMLTFPVIWLKGPKLSDSILNQWGHSQIPAWTVGKGGKPSIGRRQCTKYFKILPVRHEIRVMYPGRDCVLWMGISTDEISRAKDSGRKWLEHRWPLIEQNKSRHDCEAFLKRATSFPVPKSACFYCPYRGPKQWRKTIQDPHQMSVVRKIQDVLNPRGEFLTAHLKPVEQIDFSTEEELGQLNMFNNECEGMCGV